MTNTTTDTMTTSERLLAAQEAYLATPVAVPALRDAWLAALEDWKRENCPAVAS